MRWLKHLAIFHVVCFAWIFFRAPTPRASISMVAAMADWQWSRSFAPAFLYLAIFSVPLLAIDLYMERSAEEYPAQRAAFAWQLSAATADAPGHRLRRSLRAGAFCLFPILTERRRLMHTDQLEHTPKAERLTILVCLLLATFVPSNILPASCTIAAQRHCAWKSGVRQRSSSASHPDHRQFLFAGNSLIFEDLSQAELQRALAPASSFTPPAFPARRTTIGVMDCARSSRAAASPTCSSSHQPQPVSARPRSDTRCPSPSCGDQEIFAYQREQRLRPEPSSRELLLEHYSTYLRARNTLRIYIRKFIPGYESMVYRWPRSGATRPSRRATGQLFNGKTHHARRRMRLPYPAYPDAPPHEPIEDERRNHAKAAAEGLGIPVIQPIAEREWPLTKFREDHYHLTPPAAAEFSRLVATDLRQKLADSTARATGQ